MSDGDDVIAIADDESRAESATAATKLARSSKLGTADDIAVIKDRINAARADWQHATKPIDPPVRNSSPVWTHGILSAPGGAPPYASRGLGATEASSKGNNMPGATHFFCKATARCAESDPIRLSGSVTNATRHLKLHDVTSTRSEIMKAKKQQTVSGVDSLCAWSDCLHSVPLLYACS